jgi:hypothetical protein
LNSPVYGDLVGLYRFLDVEEVSNPARADGARIDLSALSGRDLVLNHAERRMAQLALLSMLTGKTILPAATRAAMLWHFVRLHPPRAVQLGYHKFWRRGRNVD